jgi:hypothetical protein
MIFFVSNKKGKSFSKERKKMFYSNNCLPPPDKNLKKPFNSSLGNFLGVSILPVLGCQGKMDQEKKTWSILFYNESFSKKSP